MKRGDGALTWADAVAWRAIEPSLADRAVAAASAPWVYSDRDLIDAAAALEHLTKEPVVELRLGSPLQQTRVHGASVAGTLHVRRGTGMVPPRRLRNTVASSSYIRSATGL